MLPARHDSPTPPDGEPHGTPPAAPAPTSQDTATQDTATADPENSADAHPDDMTGATAATGATTEPDRAGRSSFADAQTTTGVPAIPMAPPLTVIPPPTLAGPVGIRAARTRATVPTAVARHTRIDLGLAPIVLAVSSFGVLLVALAYADGRDGGNGAMVTYWIGQVVVFTPVAARMLSHRLAGAAESFLLVMGLAINQYFLKWMYSPDQFRFPDELQHWLATTLIMDTGKLFQANAALPPAVHFPGLAEMGAAVAALTGLPVTAAGLLVAAVAHLIFVGALFAMVARASGSPAVAGLTCVLYATALHYLFFNSMYLYQTAALPFLMLTVWAAQRWRSGGGPQFAATALVAMFVTTVSHHVTAFVTVATLGLLAVSELLSAGRPRRWSALAAPAAALLIVVLWVAFVAQEVIDYLTAPIDQIEQTVVMLLSREETSEAAPVASVALWQLAVQGAGLVALLVIYLAVVQDTLRRRDRNPWHLAAVVGGAAFFACNGVRFLGTSGPEIAGRLSTFTYVPISIIVAGALLHAVRLVPQRPERLVRRFARRPATDGAASTKAVGRAVVPPRTGTAPAGPVRMTLSRLAAGSAVATLLLVGARAGGWPPVWALLPGPYLVSGFERSIDASGLAATDWARSTLGPGHRFGGDITAVALTSTYGRQDPVRESAPLFAGERWSLTDDELAARIDLEYLWVDRRLAEQRPASGAYFEHDPRAGRHTAPLPVATVTKFDSLIDIDRVYDNGDVRIYRLGNP
jgi:hypothetical protein